MLFIDSESVRGNGKEFEVFLDTTKVRTYKDNQLLGVSVQSFSGYRNFPHVNLTNDEMVIRISNQAAGDFQLTDVYTRTLAPGDSRRPGTTTSNVPPLSTSRILPLAYFGRRVFLFFYLDTSVSPSSPAMLNAILFPICEKMQP